MRHPPEQVDQTEPPGDDADGPSERRPDHDPEGDGDDDDGDLEDGLDRRPGTDLDLRHRDEPERAGHEEPEARQEGHRPGQLGAEELDDARAEAGREGADEGARPPRAEELLAEIRRRAAEQVRTVSALWGLVSPEDRIPAYRLSMGTDLPGIGPLASAWRSAVEAELASLAPGLVVDCRSAAYLAAGRPPRAGPVPPRAALPARMQTARPTVRQAR